MTKKQALFFLILILLLTAALAGLTYFLAKRRAQPEKISPANTNAQVQDLEPPALDTSNWLTYRNEEYGFEVQYPEGWEYQEYLEGIKIGEEYKHKKITTVSFGTPASYQGGHIWMIGFHNTPEERENLIAQTGNQFSDRKEKRENIKLNDINGLLVTITTQKYSNWISWSVYFEKENVLYKINNGAIPDEKFEQFYKSFRFYR